ncbi:MAG: hypothetical protein ABIR32_14410 [Ilumatobacteraceae bacterium]
MKQRPILIDGGFVAALVDDDHSLHAAAIEIYGYLIDEFQANRMRLFSPSTVLRTCSRDVRRSTLAPVETMWVARQHRTAAKHVTAPSADVAIVMVLLQRERCRGLATTDAFYDQFDLAVYRAGSGEPVGPAADQLPDGYFNYEIEPLPARQSTGE